MTFTKLIPNIFYTDIKVGLKLFVDWLDFSVGYDNLTAAAPSCIAEKDGLSVFIIQSKEFAEKDRPEIRLQTNNIEDAYAKVSSTHPELLHPNAKKISLKPWGAKEFALLDESGICIIIQ
jgi:hypothetical protein